MTDDQLTLIEPEPPKLTARQQAALEYVAANQPCSSEDIGAYLHELRMRDGGRGHPRDQGCDWCVSEGKAMGDRLKTLGRLQYRRRHGWVVAGTPVKPASDDGYDPSTAEIPF